ncbi:Sec-independent protein translocase subunit TatA [Arthrobacter sp. 3Tela_A]|uniref:Sec-independent protein translocase subunit TatA n=1 Tax=Arthrobacter sp. 3Tela_A TaxID=3093743 RepID=UPI003BB50F84
MRLEGWHIVIIIVIAILLFGAPKLPGLARSVGQSLRIFKSEVRQMKDENTTATDGDPVEGRVVNNPGQAAPQQGPAAGTTPPSGPNTGSGNPPANP